MTWSFSHPTADRLVAFASHVLPASELRRVARHLESCAECRETVAVLRDVERSAHDAEPGDELLDRILAARSAGVRTVLPTEEVVVPAPRRRAGLLAAVAAAVLLVAFFLVRGSPEVSAGARTGFLRFDPPKPTPGAMVRVVYTPSALLQGLDSLVLRARYRRPGDDNYNLGAMQRRAAVLRRAEGGLFAGQFRLPDSVVFAVFAVESPSGDIVDDNDQRLWELAISDGTGRPLFEALVQKQRDLMGRNWEEGLKASRTLAALYANDPEAWSRLAVYERWVLGDHMADSLLSGHRRRFAAFQRELAERRGLPVGVLAGMLSYAIRLDDSAAARYWRTRLEQESPDHPDVLFRRENRLREEYIDRRKDPQRYFEELEPVWAKAEPIHDPSRGAIVHNATTHAAFDGGDTAALRLWITRYRRIQPRTPDWTGYWSKALLRYPTLRRMGMEWLRDEARLLAEGPDEYRPLTATVPQQQAANRAAAQPILAELAGALLQDGDTAAGLDTLRLAASYGWNPSVFRNVAQAWAARGDTSDALQAYARVAVDPGTPREFADSIRSITPKTSSAQWERWVKQAREEMRATVLRDASPRSLSGPMRLMSAAGKVRHLGDLAKGRVTVVVFWSPNCFFSVRPLGDLQHLDEQLHGDGAQVVAIVVDQPFSNQLRQILRDQHAEHLPTYYDYRGDTRRAFITFSTPDYYVLDTSGRVMFAHSQLEQIPRQVAALLPESLPTGR